MGVSHAEFFSVLPRLLGQDGYQVRGNTVVHEYNGKRVTFTLGPEMQRKIASISLPITQIEVSLDGFSEPEQRDFMERFDLRFRRGGG
jgi:hypothetical protein